MAPVSPTRRDACRSDDQGRRNALACVFCRKRKIRCLGGNPCRNCTDKGLVCEFVQVTHEENQLARAKRHLPYTPPRQPVPSATPDPASLSARRHTHALLGHNLTLPAPAGFALDGPASCPLPVHSNGGLDAIVEPQGFSFPPEVSLNLPTPPDDLISQQRPQLRLDTNGRTFEDIGRAVVAQYHIEFSSPPAPPLPHPPLHHSHSAPDLPTLLNLDSPTPVQPSPVDYLGGTSTFLQLPSHPEPARTPLPSLPTAMASLSVGTAAPITPLSYSSHSLPLNAFDGTLSLPYTSNPPPIAHFQTPSSPEYLSDTLTSPASSVSYSSAGVLSDGFTVEHARDVLLSMAVPESHGWRGTWSAPEERDDGAWSA